MEILSTYKNELGIAKLIATNWPKEQKERLIKELRAANVEKSSGKTGIESTKISWQTLNKG